MGIGFKGDSRRGSHNRLGHGNRRLRGSHNRFGGGLAFFVGGAQRVEVDIPGVQHPRRDGRRVGIITVRVANDGADHNIGRADNFHILRGQGLAFTCVGHLRLQIFNTHRPDSLAFTIV